MSITFSGAVKPGDSDTQFGLKDAARGQGNAISANFLALLTSFSDENANLDASGKILNVHRGDFETGALDKISEQDIDGLVSHLETGGNFDGSALFNATAAFVDSRIGALAAESVVDKSSSGLTLSTFAELFAAVDLFEKSEKINGLENSSSNQNLLDKNNLNILNDLMVGVPIKLELNDMNISSILFDIRDLKNDLEKDILLNSSELLIPQIVPINIKNANVKNDGYDPFVAVKVDLLDPEGNLGAADFIELPEHPDLEPGFRLVGVTRTVEIDPEVDPRSKLLIGLSIPENTDLKNLPDFVRFRISLEKDSRNVSEQEVMPAHELDEVSKASSAAEVNVISGINSLARQLILSLQEMSGVSSNSAQIVTKAASTDVMIPSFDMQRVLAPELNKLLLNQNNENLISLEMQSTQNSLAQNRAIFETEVKLVASMGNDVRASVTSSFLALDTELKSFFKVKNNKSDFFMKEAEPNLLEQKNVSNVFNPKSFLEAVEVLRMKPISFPASASKANLWMGGQSDVTSFASAKVDNQTPVQSGASSNSNGFASTFNNKISLYDAQYASKISMLVVDKVLKGQENFEIHLEPESFGKIKVNVLMGRQALDILMVTETQAAASLLRANEDYLLQIAGQNGLKLASFSVSMQNGTDQQRQNSNQNRNRVTGQANSVLERTKIQNSQTSTSYRTSTGLNLIA